MCSISKAIQNQKKRKKRVVHPNATFFSIDNIKQALEEQKAIKAARAKRKLERLLMEQARIENHIILFRSI
jgi:hypothetical protein